MKIIVGLGNPGLKYKNTRHNAGFLAIDELVRNMGLIWRENKKLKAQICRLADVIYAKPLTFMNESGLAVRAILSYYKLLPEKTGSAAGDLSEILTVIHDDLDIALGKYKISIDSRSAGHNGVRSIIGQLGTKNFKRLRLGIKPAETGEIPAEKYVLQKFTLTEIKNISGVINELLEKI
ncbi:aminoacyl-tRNA hydrolase [Candidatus Wolfebacteria bacterium RBG_13_41_7]|uniref:Peptidyl-tRNA hydrolase n=1 Tax=Candidatus Wolfebacteria bacterium RBG_13_41_7 TaxID=1802554 RepID=A0A1F8DNZ3_9BACT|nr:MAG: aminoacyl-tRNA hydrolase [Candidatus Wolfebacteria bacterium RBG_13_41_7]